MSTCAPGGEIIRAKDVISIYQSPSANSIQVWLTGGWGIDALLQEQMRPHKDLDIIMLVDDVVRLRDLLARAGYGLKELWSENSWVVDSFGTEIPTAFVLHSSQGREVDAHAMRLDERGNGIPAWAGEGLVFEREDLAGEGVIAGFAVRGITPTTVSSASIRIPRSCRCEIKGSSSAPKAARLNSQISKLP